MKQRFSSLDVKVIAHELSKALVSLRVANIYDLSSRIFLFKCAKPGTREQLLVDSGFRCHLTSFTRTAASTPSAFVSRLRKSLKSRRITSVKQIGTDRVIEISFSDGLYRVFLEFFAGGNIILTDRDLSVLALLRQVSEGDVDVDVKLSSQYSVSAKQNFHGVPPITAERLRETLAGHVERTKAAAETGGKKAKRAKATEDLRKALQTGFPEYPPHLLDHAFKKSGFDPLTKPAQVLGDEALVAGLLKALHCADDVYQSLEAHDTAQGFIIAKRKDPVEEIKSEPEREGSTAEHDDLLYDDFHPFRPLQFEDRADTRVLEFQGFNKTVDKFYSSLESQKLESRLTEREEAAKRKLQTAKSEHEKRVGALQQVQEMHIRKAQAIEANTHRVAEAVAAFNGLIGQGMDWMDIAKLIEAEQTRDNPVAKMVKLPLKLYENTVTLLLDEPGMEDEGDDDSEDDDYSSKDELSDGDTKPPTKQKTTGDSRLAIDIDLALSPGANARQYYDQKKSAAVKEQKTIQASNKALKSTEKKIEADLKKGLKQEKQSLRPARRQFWFEKFLYFISSDGYLVLGGKDAQQNEMLYRKYLKKGDVYVHADLQGAASVVVKNKLDMPDAPIPPSTLSQAGSLSVCTSSAWDSKAVMSAWWVTADQVSKTAVTGEYLATGGFMIRGKKNFLPPSQLLLGFAVMWHITDESKANHSKHRLPQSESIAGEDVKALTTRTENLALQNLDEDGDAASNFNSEDEEAAPDDEVAGQHSEENQEHRNDSDDGDTSTEASDVEGGAEKRGYNPLQVRANVLGTGDGLATPQPDLKDGVELSPAAESDTEEREAAAAAAAAEEEDHEPSETEHDGSSQEGNAPQRSVASSTTTTSASKPKPPARGKRTKLKRAAAKYADQDEEDRALALLLLGTTKAVEQKQHAVEDKAAKQAKLQAEKERRRAQHSRAAEAERARQAQRDRGEDVGPDDEAVGHSKKDDDENEQAAQEARDLANLDALVPRLAAGDVVLAAVPVCAPWAALARHKFKAKLQPGAVKKGKAVREMLALWTGLEKLDAAKRGAIIDRAARDPEKVWPVEVDALKLWRLEEVVGVVAVGKLRVVQGGGLAGATSGAGAGPGAGSGGAKGGRGGSGARGGKGGKKSR